jgi:hypothetical protein
MRAILSLVVAVILGGCGSGNGDGGGDSGVDGGASCPEPRSCVVAQLTGEPRPTSTSCVDGEQLPERTCPLGSECVSGTCAAPASGVTCSEDDACGSASVSCTPFVVAAGAAETYCAGALGTKFRAESCIFDRECRSGVCIPSRGTCFGRCPAVGQSCSIGVTCREVEISVEGTQVTLPSCVREL